MIVSELPYLHFVPLFYGTIFIGFGILWFVNGPVALSFFELPWPEPPKRKDNKNQAQFQQTMQVIAVVYGIRDVFMGAALYAAALCGTRQALGWITVAASCIAFVDGAACKYIVGKGQMNHWGYAPHVMVVGGALLGALDWIPIDQLVEMVSQLWAKRG